MKETIIETIKYNEPMKNHTSFKIGGPAEMFVKVDTLEKLKNILEFARKNNKEITIIGNGTNILVSDNGIDGIVIKLEIDNLEIQEEQNNKINVIVGAGTKLGYLAQLLLKKEIAGFEEFAGIPGTVGGAIVMNAGAHGKEIKDIIKEIVVIDYDGNLHTFTNEQAEFGYRKSIFLDKKYIIIQAKFEFEKGNKTQIEEKMKEYFQYRKEKQPLEFPNAGSTFKRGEDFITAKLIDEAGLKGYTIGGAQVSLKHAGFVINKGNATAKDVIELVNYIKSEIYKKFNKKIELECLVLGKNLK